jgi:hypothetical protein
MTSNADDAQEVMHFRAPAALCQQIRDLAKSEERSQSVIIRRLLNKALISPPAAEYTIREVGGGLLGFDVHIRYGDEIIAVMNMVNGFDAAKRHAEALVGSCHPQSNDALGAAQFLLDRLAELDLGQDMADFTRNFHGHVDPAISRLRKTLAAPIPNSPSHTYDPDDYRDLSTSVGRGF